MVAFREHTDCHMPVALLKDSGGEVVEEVKRKW